MYICTTGTSTSTVTLTLLYVQNTGSYMYVHVCTCGVHMCTYMYIHVLHVYVHDILEQNYVYSAYVHATGIRAVFLELPTGD